MTHRHAGSDQTTRYAIQGPAACNAAFRPDAVCPWRDSNIRPPGSLFCRNLFVIEVCRMPALCRRSFLAVTLPLAVSVLCPGLLAGCGYTWRGQKGNLSADSVLGDGSKTLRMGKVEQVTLYPWVPYAIRSQLRDEINARGLARWVDGKTADYTLGVKLTGSTIRSYSDTASGMAQLSQVRISLVLTVYDGHTNNQVWTSGTVSYSDTFEFENDETAVRETLTECVRRALDRLQQRF